MPDSALPAPRSQSGQRRYPLIGLILLAGLSTSGLAQDIGMKIIGDNDSEFGLLVAKWMDGQDSGFLAPGLIDEDFLPLEPWVLDMQQAAARALQAPTPPAE